MISRYNGFNLTALPYVSLRLIFRYTAARMLLRSLASPKFNLTAKTLSGQVNQQKQEYSYHIAAIASNPVSAASLPVRKAQNIREQQAHHQMVTPDFLNQGIFHSDEATESILPKNRTTARSLFNVADLYRLRSFGHGPFPVDERSPYPRLNSVQRYPYPLKLVMPAQGTVLSFANY